MRVWRHWWWVWIPLVSGCNGSGGVRTNQVYAPAVSRIPSPLFDPGLADSLLEAPDRDGWQKPREIVEALGIRPGMTVADIGAGSGYLLPHLSKAVGPTGRVYAEEIQESFLKRLRVRARGFRNVSVIKGTAEDPRLPGRAEKLILLTVYHEVENPSAFLQSLKRYATPESELAIIDFDAARGGTPPAPPGHEMPESAVLQEAEYAGWKLVRKHEFTSSQFFLMFTLSEVRDR